MLRYLLLLATILIILALQLGFLPGLDYRLALMVNLPLLFIVFISFFAHYETAISSALILGALLDLYSGLFFGFFILLLAISVIIIKFFLNSILQNKNIGVLLFINLIAVFIWQLAYILTIIIYSRFFHQDTGRLISPQYFIYLIYQIIIHSLIIILFSPVIKQHSLWRNEWRIEGLSK